LADDNNPFLLWLQAQYALEVNSFNNDPPRLSPEDRKDFVRWNAYALEDELHEATQEVAWKPWASTTHFNREQFLKEMTDVMFFAGNMVLIAARADSLYADVPSLAEELWEMYQAKVKVNAARMAEGYDGKLEKCTNCDRELENGLCPVCDGDR
jgi:bisphosphoglycerate-dependent phosphoglycerate mutase